MLFNSLEKFMEKSSPISNYDLLVLENEYYKKFTDVSESISLLDSCLYEIEILSYVNKNNLSAFEDLAIPSNTNLAVNEQKGKLSQIWAKVIEFLKKIWNQLSELFKKAKEFLFAKSKNLINRISKLGEKVKVATSLFSIVHQPVVNDINKISNVYSQLAELGTIITENMTLEQTKSVEENLKHIDKELNTLDKIFDDFSNSSPITEKVPGAIVLAYLKQLKQGLELNVEYIDKFNKNIDSAKEVMKKMHPDRFVGQDQTLPTAITATASAASSSYRRAIKHIKNFTDIVENSISPIEKQVNEQLSKN